MLAEKFAESMIDHHRDCWFWDELLVPNKIDGIRTVIISAYNDGLKRGPNTSTEYDEYDYGFAFGNRAIRNKDNTSLQWFMRDLDEGTVRDCIADSFVCGMNKYVPTV